jgi:predicted kinase
MERTNKNGDLLCAYCCKPIVKPYDCIAHHKNHLTESNVFDVNISLNPDNIEFVHHACHNRIHEKGYKTKKVYIVYGSPCSGKSTFVNSVCMPDDLILDIDRIYNCVNNSRSNLVYPNVMQIYRFILDMIKTRSGAWNNAYIVRGLPTNAERERLASQIDGELIFIDTDKETCLERSKQKGKDYYKFVNDWWSKYSESEM